MFTDNNNIIVVDDDREALDRIAKVFNNHGIGCKLIETDGYDLPDEPLKGVKIAFLDINYNNQGDDNAMFATLLGVIKGVISKDNGPFVLVFWTTNKDKIEAFKSFVNRDRNVDDIAHPISITLMDKTAFDDNSLPEEIDKVYSNPLVKCLFSFTEQLRDASDNCINEIFSHIPKDEEWGDSSTFSNKFKELFAKIAITTYGMEKGRQFPDKAIKESLVPVFSYSLCTNDNKCWENYLKLNNSSNNQLKKIDIKYISPYLNTIYHIDKDVADNTRRGIVRMVKTDDDRFTNKIGYNKEYWVNTRFLKDMFKLDDLYELVAIEYSAACDYANNKNRLHKYMMGILCSENDYYKFIEQKKNPSKGIPENIYPLDFVFVHNDNVKGMILDLNSTISEDVNDKSGILGDAIFHFKHELMSKITSIHANHESRIGYSYF